MMPSQNSILETRHDQVFPVLEAAEIGRITRLGELRAYPAGVQIITAGEVAPGAFVLISGHVDITHRSGGRGAELIVVNRRPEVDPFRQ